MHIEGPLRRIPDGILRDIFDHFISGGVDDFSMSMWQNRQFGIDKWNGKLATFHDARTSLDIEVSRFGYDDYRQSIGKQITVATVPRPDESQRVDYCLTFGGPGNKNRQSFQPPQSRCWINGIHWLERKWGVWKPLHLRNRDWDCLAESNILRATATIDTKLKDSSSNRSRDSHEQQHSEEDEAAEETEGDLEAKFEREWAAEMAFLEKASERGTKKRPRRSSVSDSNDQAVDISSTAEQPPKRKMRIIFHNSRAEGLVPEGPQPRQPSSVQVGEPVQVKPEPEVEIVDLEETEPEPESNIEGGTRTNADTIEVSLPIRQESSLSNAPTAIHNENPTFLSQNVTSENPTTTGFDAINVEFQFQNADSQVQEVVTISECSTASELFDYACASEIADRKTPLLEIQIGTRRPARIMKDNEIQFQTKVIQPLKGMQQMVHAVGNAEKMIVVVKKYL